MKIQWHHETRPLAELREYDRNPRRILEKGFKNLQESLDEFGLAEPLCIQPDGLIIGGHARYKVLIAAGETEADCMVPDRPLTHEEMKRLNLRLNKNTAGIFDMDMLAADFEIPELKEMGFEDFELGIDVPENKDHEVNETLKTNNKCPKCGYEF
jgi:hypothetical protein